MKYDIRKKKRKPDYKNLLNVLEGKKPLRPTLFEFFLNDNLYAFLIGEKTLKYKNIYEYYCLKMKAYEIAGYDYITVLACDLQFNTFNPRQIRTKSLNDAIAINDRISFSKFNWPDAKTCDYSRLDYISERLPDGMRIVPYGPGGVLENVISIMGYDNLCYAGYDNPQLLWDIFEKVGSTLVEYYKLVSNRNDVAAVISNDDWGFNTQLMISDNQMRKYVLPWHKEIVKVIHGAGKHAILHSCGNLKQVMDDIIDMGYDAKHSYEDNIYPVEAFYSSYNEKITVLGGIDLDFLCRATSDEIYKRSSMMVEKAVRGYALGSGNSIPEYVPIENYMAMIAAAYK